MPATSCSGERFLRVLPEAGRLTFKVNNHKIVAGKENLAEMVVRHGCG